MSQYRNGIINSTGAAVNLALGFVPDEFSILNYTKTVAGAGVVSSLWINHVVPNGDALITTVSAGSTSQAVLSNKTNQSVAIVTTAGTGAVTFDTNTVLGAGFTHTVGSAGLTVLSAGLYRFIFDVSGTESNQFQIFVNNVGIPGTTFGSGAGTQQNTGFGFLTLAANDVVTLVNSASAAAVTLAASTPIGGTNVDNSNATLSLSAVGVNTSGQTLLTSNGITPVILGGDWQNTIYSITGISNASPGVVTVASATPTNSLPLVNGMTFTISGVNGMRNLNTNRFVVAGLSGTTFNLYDTFGNPVDTTGLGTFTTSPNGEMDVISYPPTAPVLNPVNGQVITPGSPAGLQLDIGYEGLTLGTGVVGSSGDVLWWEAEYSTPTGW